MYWTEGAHSVERGPGLREGRKQDLRLLGSCIESFLEMQFPRASVRGPRFHSRCRA